ncbi:hypothetical protein B0H63DRAFT_529009 [Podospora didyma]|uniref:Aminoglycoside phosphotransferase domain-containing protein n=1 Tax=Podospora didyma TaxID=330526 RepID=A0AAE0K310_9PEZI|nr:hypothetical protein B0H63DRAFT_529009 [Podospora didyma]
MSREFHKCTSLADLDDAPYDTLVADEFGRLRALINDKAVRDLASRLNNGKSCVIEYPCKDVDGSGVFLAGCANYHARIRFVVDGNDDETRLLRVPRITGFAVGFPVSLAEYLIRSEYATLKFLETTAVPAPKVFSFGIPSQGTDQSVGVCFLLMEELPGKPWNGKGDAAATEKIWKGLANVYSELDKHPLPKAGSLCVQSPDDIVPFVAELASDRFVCIDPCGPFETAADYYTTWAEQHLVLIANHQMYPQFPVDAYLVYCFLRDDATPKLLDSEEEEDKFFSKHVDDKGDYLLVGEDLNITGIIDWQMARVVPRREAFALSLVSADMGAVYDGKVSLSENDIALGSALRERDPRFASQARDEKVRRFFWGLGLEVEWASALPLANAVLQVFGVEQSWDAWEVEALKWRR